MIHSKQPNTKQDLKHFFSCMTEPIETISYKLLYCPLLIETRCGILRSLINFDIWCYSNYIILKLPPPPRDLGLGLPGDLVTLPGWEGVLQEEGVATLWFLAKLYDKMGLKMGSFAPKSECCAMSLVWCHLTSSCQGHALRFLWLAGIWSIQNWRNHC